MCSRPLFLFIVSAFYVLVAKDDYLDHMIGPYLFLGGIFGHRSFFTLATAGTGFFIGGLMCPYLRKYVSQRQLIVAHLGIYLMLIDTYANDLSYYLCDFFLGIGVYMIGLKVVPKLRSAPYILMSLRAWIHGIPIVYIDDPELMKTILKKTTLKGSFIEEKLSTRAWLPIRSVESVDGKEWNELRRKFNTFMATLPSIHLLNEIATIEIEKVRQSEQLIDRQCLSRLVATIFLRWISGSSNDVVIESLVCATEEWRKEIPLKGKGDLKIKEAAINALRNHLKVDEIDFIIQPFFISPMINITDIMSSVVYSPQLTPRQMVIKSILTSHPFPFLERFVSEDIGPIRAGTQVFIPLAKIAATAGDEWMCFSVGPRMCPGNKIAMCLLEGLVGTLASSPHFKPTHGHRFSGRKNDTDIGDIIYFMRSSYYAITGSYTNPYSK